jgi:hypothetical protein
MCVGSLAGFGSRVPHRAVTGGGCCNTADALATSALAVLRCLLCVCGFLLAGFRSGVQHRATYSSTPQPCCLLPRDMDGETTEIETPNLKPCLCFAYHGVVAMHRIMVSRRLLMFLGCAPLKTPPHPHHLHEHVSSLCSVPRQAAVLAVQGAGGSTPGSTCRAFDKMCIGVLILCFFVLCRV